MGMRSCAQSSRNLWRQGTSEPCVEQARPVCVCIVRGTVWLCHMCVVRATLIQAIVPIGYNKWADHQIVLAHFGQVALARVLTRSQASSGNSYMIRPISMHPSLAPTWISLSVCNSTAAFMWSTLLWLFFILQVTCLAYRACINTKYALFHYDSTTQYGGTVCLQRKILLSQKYRVCILHKCFCFALSNSMEYMQWFAPVDNQPYSQTGMWVVALKYNSHGICTTSIIHCDLIM